MTDERQRGSYEIVQSRGYDRIGRVKKINLPDKSSITYKYDALFGHSVKRLSPDGKIQYSHSYDSYDDLGKLTREISFVGSRTFSYDKSGRPLSFQTDYFSEIIPDNGYDCLGNLLETTRSGIFPFQSQSYSYDSLSQLAIEKSEHSCNYSYDSLSNCRFANDNNLCYNNLNQLTNHSQWECSYDSLGNLSRKANDNNEIFLTFDVLSNLVSILEKKGCTNTIHHFSYDAFGRRLAKEQFYIKGKKKMPLSSSRAFYCEYDELGAVDEAGKIQELRVPGCEGVGLSQSSIAIEIGQKAYAPLHDITGNVVALIDPVTKSVAESYTYSAFSPEKIYNSSGKAICCSAIGNPWRYKEKRIDEETGLLYFGLRYYDPQIHRWISQDPLGLIDGPNRYAFVQNNPLRYFDRLGLAAEDSSNDSLKNYFYGEVETHCYCERHRTCKRGGDIRTAVGGASLGVSGFFMGILNQFAQAGFLATADDFGFDRAFKQKMNADMQDSLSQLHGMWNEGLVAAINFDPTDELANRFEKGAFAGLVGLDILRGNIGDIRAGLAFFKKAKGGIEIFEKNAKHIFRNAPGHVPDIPFFRNLLIETASNPKNYLGKDKFGNHWHSKIQKDGSQVWTISRNGQIRDAGINLQPRNFNSITGLSQLKETAYE